MDPGGSVLRAVTWIMVAALGSAAIGCTDGDVPGAPPEATGSARAYGIWVPGPGDDCTAEQHNQYAVVGADAKLYPTWHPPSDPETGCSFGHEHGRDPRGSDLYRRVGPIPFGLANEAGDIEAAVGQTLTSGARTRDLVADETDPHLTCSAMARRIAEAVVAATICISTAGNSPLLARRIRQALEVQFDPAYETYVDLLGALRPVVQEQVASHQTQAALVGAAGF